MGDLEKFVDVIISAQDTIPQQVGFGTIAIYHEFSSSIFSERSRTYTDTAGVSSDFSTTSKEYLAAQAIFSQNPSVNEIKIIRKDSGDADHTTALDAIIAIDPDFYAIVTPYRDETTIAEIAAWVLTQEKIFLASSEDAGIISTSTTDLGSDLKNASNNRTALFWHEDAGLDVTVTSIVVATLVATVDATSHGLEVGDNVYISGATPTELNGKNVVVTVADTDTFTFATTAGDGTATGTILAFGRYIFPSSGWAGRLMPFNPDNVKVTWHAKSISGIIPSTLDKLSTTGKGNLEDKNVTYYTSVRGVPLTFGAKMASGRFIDVQVAIDWLKARIQESIFLEIANLLIVPFTDAGISVISGKLRGVLNDGLSIGHITPLSIDNSPEGLPFIIEVPTASSISAIDRGNRLLPDIPFTAQIGQAIHKVVINGTLKL